MPQEAGKERFRMDIKGSEGTMQGCISALLASFPGSFINKKGEFIAHGESNQYLIVANCRTPFDVRCKVLEWFSRPAHKTSPCNSGKENSKFHNFMLNGVNQFLGTDFSRKEMELIYTYLGNACNHKKTIQFVQSGYDMRILEVQYGQEDNVQGETYSCFVRK